MSKKIKTSIKQKSTKISGKNKSANLAYAKTRVSFK